MLHLFFSKTQHQLGIPMLRPINQRLMFIHGPIVWTYFSFLANNERQI